MTCQDFQREWNELLDTEAVAAGAPNDARSIDDIEALLLAHAADCPACRPIAAGYQALRHAIRAWRQPPPPPADLVDRVLSMSDDQMPGTGRSADRRTRTFWYAHRSEVRLASGLAAAVLVCMTLGMVLYRVDRQPSTDRLRPDPQNVVRRIDPISVAPMVPDGPPALDRALAEATSATWDLARSASGPAARISREMLDATVQTGDGAVERSVRPSATASADPDEGLAGLSLSVPSLDPLGRDAAEASTILQHVGDHLSAGVRPLSSTAQHAFGFLLGPPPARDDSRRGGSTSRGA